MDESNEVSAEESTGDEASVVQGATPEEQLEKLQKKQEKQQKRLDELEQRLKATDDAIAELEEQIGEVGNIVDEYEANLPDYQLSVQNLEGYAAIKTAMLEAVVDAEDVQAIEAAIAGVESGIEDLQAIVDAKKAEYEDALAAETAAEAAVTDRQADWDAAVNHQASIEDNLSKINDLRTEIESEEEAEAYAVMYYYMGQLNDCLDETKVLTTTTPDALRTQLHEARAAIDAAEEAAAQAIEDRKAAEEALEEAQKNLDEAQAARLDNILDALRTIEIKP